MENQTLFFCPEACFTMEATGISFEKCVVNFNLQIEMSLNHTADNSGSAFQSRHNFERFERESQAFEIQQRHWHRFMLHPAIVSCGVDCTLVQNVLPYETEKQYLIYNDRVTRTVRSYCSEILHLWPRYFCNKI